MRGVVLPSIGSLIFFVIAPGTVAGYVPWRLSLWRLQSALLGWNGLRGFGVILIAGGVAALLDCFARFAIQGRGTPAPVMPTERVVVSGLYRYVQNPMYLAVVSAIVGQGLLLGNTDVLWYGAAVFVGFHLFVRLYEEPTLRRTHGADYDSYCRTVRRWWPRLR